MDPDVSLVLSPIACMHPRLRIFHDGQDDGIMMLKTPNVTKMAGNETSEGLSVTMAKHSDFPVLCS
jgi:hypothetical protein